MRDGSLAKNKPPSACRDVNHVTLLIRNCWIVLKSDLKHNADSELVDSFSNSSLRYAIKKKEKEKKMWASSGTGHMDTFSRKGEAVHYRDE